MRSSTFLSAAIVTVLAHCRFDPLGLQEAWSGKGVCELGHTMCLAARADALRLAGMPHTFGTDEPEGDKNGDENEEDVPVRSFL